MPTYQYQCTDCGEALEVVQAFTDDSLTECPTCGGRLRKLFNAVGIVFKGSGFYRTDSRSGSSASTASIKPRHAMPMVHSPCRIGRSKPAFFAEPGSAWIGL